MQSKHMSRNGERTSVLDDGIEAFPSDLLLLALHLQLVHSLPSCDPSGYVDRQTFWSPTSTAVTLADLAFDAEGVRIEVVGGNGGLGKVDLGLRKGSGDSGESHVSARSRATTNSRRQGLSVRGSEEDRTATRGGAVARADRGSTDGDRCWQGRFNYRGRAWGGAGVDDVVAGVAYT